MTKEYIAGFFDADGYVTVTSSHSNEEPSAVAGFTNTVRPLLVEIQRFISKEFQLKGSIGTKKAYKSNHHIGYDLKYRGNKKVIELLSKLPIKHPKKVKRYKILKKIAKYTVRNGKYQGGTLDIRRKFVTQFLFTE